MTLRACRRFLAAACIAVGPVDAIAAQVAAADSARLLDRDAQLAFAAKTTPDRDRAIHLWTAAHTLFERAGDRIGSARMLWRIGAAQFAIGRVDSAAVNLYEAITRARDTKAREVESNALYDLGMLHGRMARWDSAMVAFREALAIKTEAGDTTVLTRIHAGIAALHRQSGRADSARAHFGIIVERVRSDPDRYFAAKVLTEVGLLHGWAGRIDSAMVYAREVAAIYRAIGDRNGESGALGAIAMAYSGLGRTDSAKFYYQQSLDIKRAIGDAAGEAGIAGNVAMLSDNADSAIVRLRQAVALARMSKDSGVEANGLSALAAAHAIAGHRDSAMVHLRRSLALLRAHKLPRDSSFVYQAAGQTWQSLGVVDSALVYLGLALGLRRGREDPWGEAQLYHAIGVVHHRSPKRPNLARAQAYYDSSAVAVEALRRFTGGDNNLISFGELADSLFGDWSLAWLASSSAGGPGVSARAALATTERGRAQALLALMRDTAVRSTPGSDFPSEGARLISGLRRSGSAGLVYLSTRDTLLIWLIPTSGEVAVFRRAINRQSLTQLVGDYRNALGVENGGTRLALRGSAPERATDYASQKGRRPSGRLAVDQLANALLPPELMRQLTHVDELVIFPQGILALVPFAALPAGQGAKTLGTMLAIRYSPSLVTLDQVEARTSHLGARVRAASLKRALVIGNPQMPEAAMWAGERDRLAPLPGAEAESQIIATRLGAPNLVGRAATETEVRRQLPGATVVHLATHGFAYSSEAKARNSFIALSPDSVNDGLLTVGEILDDPRLNLIADLVVLSACQTGLGDLKQAEGTVGLQRAFLAKGARSVLVSLWNVSDQATRLLMEAFYRHWLGDSGSPTKAEALRRAEEDVRKTPGFEHPRFWAGFQLVGAE